MKAYYRKVRAKFNVRKTLLSLPALAGLALLCYGISLIYFPAALIAGGLSLLWIDNRL